jgi:Domain of unknown function (DUF4174)
MTKLLLCLALLAPCATAQQTLATLVDRNRVLLLFTPTALDGRYGQQLDALNHHEADLRARDLIVIPLIQQAGPPNLSPALRALQPPHISDDEQLTIRRRFHIAANEFAVILLSKEGSEKLRSTTPITITRLNRTIDAMPAHK